MNQPVNKIFASGSSYRLAFWTFLLLGLFGVALFFISQSVSAAIPLPTLNSISVSPNPVNSGNSVTVNFDSPANQNFCAFQYKLQTDSIWSSTITGLCAGITFFSGAAGIYDVQGAACQNDGTCSAPFRTNGNEPEKLYYILKI